MTNLVGSINPVEVGRIYLMGLQFPGELNEASPLMPPPPPRLQLASGEWLVKDAERASLYPRIRNVRRHFGVVLQWNPTTRNAVILIGTSRPRRPHRYIPWFGTPRTTYQTKEVLMPTPRDVFIDLQGHLNFTHAIRVRVIVSGEHDSLTVPGQSFFKDASSSLGGFPATLDTNEVQKLFQLHEDYWGGVRFKEDGSPLDGDGNGDSGDDEDTSDFLDKTPEALSRAAWKLTVPPAPPIFPVVPGGNIGTVHNPVDPVTGLLASQLMRIAGEEEDFRATQLEFMQGIGVGDLSQDVGPMISCYLEEVSYNPVTHVIPLCSD